MAIFKFVKRETTWKPADSKGYCVYYISDEGFYVRWGIQSEVVSELDIDTFYLVEEVPDLENDFFFKEMQNQEEDVECMICRLIDQIDADKPRYKKRKTARIEQFQNRWEVRALTSTLSDGTRKRKFFPEGKSYSNREKIEFLSYSDPKEVRKFTDNYIPIFILQTV